MRFLKRKLSILIVKKKNKFEEFKKVEGYLKNNGLTFYYQDEISGRIVQSSCTEMNLLKQDEHNFCSITTDDFKSQTKNPIDLLISLGVGGTMLHCSSLFPW